MADQQNAMDTGAFLRQYIDQVQQTLGALPLGAIEQMVDRLHEARLTRAQVFLCGNGGSAATASHFCNDLNKGANAPGVPRYRAVALNDNVPLLTAWSNDASYGEAFAEPLANLALPGDLLVAISCSGNSENVLQAVSLAKELGLYTIGMTGSPGGKLGEMADLPIRVSPCCMEQLEDVHMLIEHLVVSALRDRARNSQVPQLLLANGRAATPQSPALVRDVPRRAAVFVDRDGVINANLPQHVRSWDEFELLPGALDALRALERTGLPIVVVTNQSAVNRGLVRYEVAESINRRLIELAAAQGIRIDAVAWCPHRPEEACHCRKPASGMLEYAAASLALDLERSYLIGDAVADLEAGLAVGCRTALVMTGRGRQQLANARERLGASLVVLDDLAQAARWVHDIQAAARSGESL